MMRFRGQLLRRCSKEGEDPMAEQPILDDEEAILRVVQAWPRSQQVHLAHRILDPGLATLDPQTGRPVVSSAELRGIGAGDRTAPSDEEIERWRMEKHAE
jgi:hypothetical protein